MSEWVRSAYMHWNGAEGSSRAKWQFTFEERSTQFSARFPERVDLLLFVEANFEDTMSCRLLASSRTDAEKRLRRALDLYAKIPIHVPSIDQTVAAWNNCGFLYYKWFAFDASPNGSDHRHSSDGTVDSVLSSIYSHNSGRSDWIEEASKYIDKAMAVLDVNEGVVIRSLGPGVLARTLFDSAIKIEGVRSVRGNPDSLDKLKRYLASYESLLKNGTVR